jgi:hypothetical protein
MKLSRQLLLWMLAAGCVYLFTFSTVTKAQQATIQIGTQYSYVNNIPFFNFYYTTYPYTRVQLKYRKAEMDAALTAAGIPPGPVKIKSVAYQSSYWYNYGNANLTYPVTIKVGHSPDPWFTIPQPWGNPLPTFDPMTNATNCFHTQNYTFVSTYNMWQSTSSLTTVLKL